MIPLKDDNPTYSFPYVTISIIALNVFVFFLEVTGGPRHMELFIFRAAAIPYEITHLVDLGPVNFVSPPWTLLTAMFVHGGPFHLIGNMLYLWIFGDNIEDRLGHFRFLLFYLGTGIAASLTHILMDPHSTVPMVGASGAIAGVLGAYFLLFPTAYVHTLIIFFFFIQVVRLPALFFLGLWFLMQVMSSTQGGGIAWFAHIGGFLAGMLAILVLKPRRYPGRLGRRL